MRSDIVGSVVNASDGSVFVGRRSELAALDDVLRRASAGEPQGVLIAGEAGVGKTGLVRKFLLTAEAAGAVTAVGNCLDGGAAELPYAPFVTAMRHLHRILGSELEHAASGYENQLSVLIPDFHGAGPAPSDTYGRAQFFACAARFIERLAEVRPLVLVIEDLHWSDRSTRELLAYLVRSLHTSPVVLAASYRMDELHRRHPLYTYLAEMEQLPTVRRLVLAPFVRAEVEEQLTGLLDTSNPEFRLTAGQIYERSAGNAFFVEELARSYQRLGVVGLSNSLRELLLVQLDALPETTRDIVVIAAVSGSYVEQGLLAAVTEVSASDLLTVIRTAIDSHILVIDSETDGLTFRHALMRDAVLDDQLPARRQRINRLYAMALESHPELVRADQRAGRLASYWYHARVPNRALPTALNAARHARRRNAFAEQVLMLKRALQLWEQVPEAVRNRIDCYDCADEAYPAGTGGLTLVDVLADATIAADLSGDPRLGVQFAKTATDLVDDTVDPERAAWFWLQRSRMILSDGATGVQETEQARLLVEERPPSAVQADVLHRVAGCGALMGPSQEHVAIGERAARIARKVGARNVELHTLNTVGMLRVHLGEIDEGLAMLHSVCMQSRDIDDPYLQTRAYVNLGAQYEKLGRSQQALEITQEGLGLAKRFGIHPPHAGMLIINLIDIQLALGQLDEAEELLTSTVPNTLLSIHPLTLVMSQAELAFLRGDLVSAAELLARVRHDDRQDRQSQVALPRADLAVRIAMRTGRFTEARAELLIAIGDGLPPHADHYVWPLLMHGAAAEADSWNLTEAENGRSEVLERIRCEARLLSRIVPLYDGWAYLLDAELARAEGQDTPAQWIRAVEALRPTGRPYPLAYALLKATEACLSGGEREKAQVLVREADEQTRKRGDRELMRKVAEVAVQGGLPLTAASSPALPTAATEAPDPIAALGLTAREREVLRLVTLGYTNRQIGEALYVSPKTASVHVSNILIKLQVENRGQAAATARRLQLFPHTTT